MEERKELKILGMPVPIFVCILLLMAVITMWDSLLNNMIGAMTFALFIGTALGFVGDRIPVWKDWFGGGMLFTVLMSGVMNTYGLIPKNVIGTLNTFNGQTGFLEFYILILITGSVISVDRKLLIKSFAGYIPTILAGIAVAFALAAGTATLFGVNPIQAILDIAIPIMGGGNGAGAIPMSKIWAEITGKDTSGWYATAFATLSIGNLFAVIFGALLNRVGLKYPSLTGNSQLMKGMGNQSTDTAAKAESAIGPLQYAAALGLGLFCYTLAHFYSGKLSIINNFVDWGFSIHKFAFMIVLVAILNVAGIIPAEIRAGAKGLQMFFAKYMSLPLMVTVGIGTNINDFVKVMSPSIISISFMVVVGASIGTAIVGKLFNFYFVEAVISAGLCMANGGGSGDVQVLGAAKRMELMPYAQISSRIGGAMMLIIASFMFARFAQYFSG